MRALRDYASATGQVGLIPTPVRFDEVARANGSLRDPWRRLEGDVADFDLGSLQRVGAEIDRMLTDDGVIYTPPGEFSVPWRLDPVPLLIEPSEWSDLEGGLTQRAELLNALLVDLYGPQRVLSEGLLPPEIVFGHSGFLRVIARRSAADERPLVISATDLGRTADGTWRVLADRVQAPSGIGFAMENRRVISRVMPEMYRAAFPHRVAPFFQALRSALVAVAPEGVDTPRVVVLSPGPMSETAFDQSMIAARLGFPLVEGSDLTVRDGHVFMRFLGNFERVDVILRRVDAAWSDPLELRGDSHLGVPGLTEALRRGTVRVVNGLGSGVLENPALLPFLPSLCRALLDEPLRLESIPTWWAGDPEQRSILESRLGALTVRPIDEPNTVVDPMHARELIAQAPHRYVGQEIPSLSVSPALANGTLIPEEVRLRTFTMWHGSTYRPLLGGLATSRPHGPGGPGVSKDVWVLKSDPADPDQGLGDLGPTIIARSPVAMGPRILDDLFWFGRYVERLEDTVRLLISVHGLAQDFQDRPSTIGGQTLASTSAALDALSPPGSHITRQQQDFFSLLLDSERVGSVAETLQNLRRVTQGVRDQVSPDLFRVFGAIDRALSAVRMAPHSAQIGESAGRILTDALAMGGVTSNMMRDAGWHLIRVGTGIERGLQLMHLVTNLMLERAGLDVERETLGVALAASESAITHGRRYHGTVRVANVLELLLLDPDNPRSLKHSLQSVQEHLAALPNSTGSTRPERLVQNLLAELEDLDVGRVAAVDGAIRPELTEFAVSVKRQLMVLSDAVADVHFPVGPSQRQFGFAVGATP